MDSTRTRVIYSECADSYWVDAARLLSDHHGWDIVGWIGHASQREPIMAINPQAVFQESPDARVGLLPETLADMPLAPVDEPLLRAMSRYESMTFKMMERFDLLDYFSHAEKTEHYYHTIMIWQAILDRLKPDLVVFSISPHVVYDYILFALCKIRGINTLMFERTTLAGMLYPLEDWEEVPQELASTYRDLLASDEPVALAEDVEQQLIKMRGGYREGMAAHMLTVLSEKGQGNHFAHLNSQHQPPGAFTRALKRGTDLGRRIASIIDSLFIKGPPQNYYKKAGRPLGDRRMTLGEFIRHRLRVRKAKKAINDAYERLSCEPDLSVPYIYVALQGQPERQATPNGGVYCNQYLVADALSKAVPAGWRVYVKEHIVQLAPQAKPERSRSPRFYEYIAGLPHTQLVPLKTNSFDLIDNAKAVATISGSTGWEGAVRGKPALLFGYAWYRGCEGVFEAHDTDKLRDAIARIEAGYAVDPAKVRKFAAALERTCFRGYCERRYQALSNIPDDVNAERLSESLAGAYDKILARKAIR